MNSLHYSPPFPVPKNSDILVLRRVCMWLGWLYLFRRFVASRSFYGLTGHGLACLRGGGVVLAEVLWGWAVFGGVFSVVPEPPPCVVCLGCLGVFFSTTIIYIFSTNFGRFRCAFRSFCRDYILFLVF